MNILLNASLTLALSMPLSLADAYPTDGEAATSDMPNTSVALEMRVPLASLRDSVNGTLPSPLFQQSGIDLGCGFGHCTAQLSVLRRGDIGLTSNGTQLTATIPLDIRVRLDWYKKVAFAKIRHHEDGHANIDVTATSSVFVAPNWALQTQTQANVSVPHARIDLPISSVSVRGVVTDVAQKNADKLVAKLDEKIRESVNLRREAEQIWQRLAAPIRLGEDPPLWLSVRPHRVKLAQPRASDDHGSLVVPIGAEAKLTATMGPKPTSLDLGPLADLEQSVPTLSGWRSEVPLVIDLATLNTWLAQQQDLQPSALLDLLGEDMTTKVSALIGKDASLGLAEVDIATDVDRLMIAIDFKAATDGDVSDATVYLALSGIPSVTESGRQVVLNQSRFQLTIHVIPRDDSQPSMALDIPGTFTESPVFEIGQRIDRFIEGFATTLGDLPLGENARFQGKVDEYGLRDLIIGDKILTAVFVLKGDGTVDWQMSP